MRRSTTSGASPSRRSGCSATTCTRSSWPALSYSSVLKPVHDVLIFRALRRVARRGARHPLVQRRQALVPPLREVRLRVARLPGVPPRRDEPSPPSVTATCSTIPPTSSGSSRCSGWPTTRPFECIGQIDEARLAFELLRRRGVTGAAMRMYEDRIGARRRRALYAELIAVAREHHAMPPDLAERGHPGPRATGARCRWLVERRRLDRPAAEDVDVALAVHDPLEAVVGVELGEVARRHRRGRGEQVAHVVGDRVDPHPVDLAAGTRTGSGRPRRATRAPRCSPPPACASTYASATCRWG